MGALPKIKISKGRRNRRRAHDSLSMPALSTCPKCGKVKRPHFLCSYCKNYRISAQTQIEEKKEVTKDKEKNKLI